MRYCQHTKVLRPATLKGYRDVFGQFCRLMPEVVTPADLTRETLDLFFARLRTRCRQVGAGSGARGVKASTVRTYGSKLHTFFDWLCARDLLTVNPVQRRDLAQPIYDDQRALTRDEVDRLFGAIVQNAATRFLLKRNLAMIQVLLFTGLRKTEFVSLTLGDLDLVRQTVTVSGRTSKSKRTRLIPITPETAQSLEDYLRERRTKGVRCARLWASTRGDRGLTEHGLKHWVETLKRQSGVSFHLHRFRHTYACMLGRTNASAVKIQKLLGHSDLRMTQTYLRSLGVEDLRESVECLSRRDLA